jgi:hypothetical protein
LADVAFGNLAQRGEHFEAVVLAVGRLFSPLGQVECAELIRALA